jgi:hypothetical protein
MKKVTKIASFINLLMFTASVQMLGQGVTMNQPTSTLNNSASTATQNSILSYIMGWVKWIVIVGIVVSIGMTAFYFLTGNKDKGKTWAMGCVTGILIWFLAPSILGAFGITLNW